MKDALLLSDCLLNQISCSAAQINEKEWEGRWPAEDVKEAAGQRAEAEQNQMQLHGGNPKDFGECIGFGTGRDLERIAYAGFHSVFQGTEYETRGGDYG